MTRCIHPLPVAIVFFVLCCFEACNCDAKGDAWTDDEVAIARLTVSEASFRPGNDARVITWIVTHGARRRGLTPALYVARIHHRHTRSASRPWLAGLGPNMSEPAGWPASVSWPDRGAPAWTRRLEEVRRYMAEDEHGCDGQPTTWAGTMDTPGLRRWEARGYRVLRCGPTRNRIVGR